jgi:hypothetical protein
MATKRNETRVKLAQFSPDGTIAKNDKGDELVWQSTETSAEKEIAAAKAKGEDVQAVTKQTFVFTTADTVDEILGLVNDKAAVAYFNRGYILEQQKAAIGMLMDDEFKAIEGVYDLQADVAEAKERVRKARKSVKDMSAEELLSNIDPKVLESLMALIQSQSAASPA